MDTWVTETVGDLENSYQQQVAEVHKLLERYVRESDQLDVEKYLRICEELGQEPDPAKMPLEPSEFPEEVQVAFFIYEFLEDHWEGMSGTYLGKHWNNLNIYLSFIM